MIATGMTTTTVRPAYVRRGRRQLYMLPTRHGLLFTFVLATLLLAAVNYNNGLAYALAFVLASIAVVSMFHTHRNLAGLRITAGPCRPVFAGQRAEFTFCLDNNTAQARAGVRVKHAGEEIACLDLPSGEQRCFVLSEPSRRRGRLAAPSFQLATQYPLGLLYSWSRDFKLEHYCLIYPRPAPASELAAVPGVPGEHGGAQPEGDDFIGLREFRVGDPPRHVSWKTAARGQGMYTKQFGADRVPTVWFDWEDIADPNTENRLSLLCRWVIDAESNGLRYGLRLPGIQLPPDSGQLHCHRCLEQLALFEG